MNHKAKALKKAGFTDSHGIRHLSEKEIKVRSKSGHPFGKLNHNRPYNPTFPRLTESRIEKKEPNIK